MKTRFNSNDIADVANSNIRDEICNRSSMAINNDWG